MFDLADVQNGDVEIEGGGSVHAGDGVVKHNGSVVVDLPGTIEFTSTPDPASGPSTYTPDPPAVTGVAVQDPFAAVTLPSWASAPQQAVTVSCGDTTLQPGIYGTIEVKNTTCTLAPGTYFVTKQLNFTGNSSSSLVAAGVTIVFTCGSGTTPAACPAIGQAGGKLDASGQGRFTMTGWAVPSFSLIYDRNNTAILRLTGNAGTTQVDGAIYAARSQIVINGNGSATDVKGQMVIGSLDMNGNNATLSIRTPSLAPPPAPPRIALSR